MLKLIGKAVAEFFWLNEAAQQAKLNARFERIFQDIEKIRKACELVEGVEMREIVPEELTKLAEDSWTLGFLCGREAPAGASLKEEREKWRATWEQHPALKIRPSNGGEPKQSASLRKSRAMRMT